jgi:hypothetical protein
MKILYPMLLAGVLPAAAHDAVDSPHERTITLASQLAPWCRAEAEARVVAEGGTPYQWASSYHERGNVLHVEGTLRVDGEDIGVRCRIARGAREFYASIEFVERGATRR